MQQRRNQSSKFIIGEYKAIESFRFEDENDYEYEIKLKVFARVLKKRRHPGKFYFTFLHHKS